MKDSRRMVAAGALLLLLAGAVTAQDKFMLGPDDGLDGTYEVQEFEAEKQTVQLGGQSGTIVRPFGDFTPEVQKQILAWAADEAFGSSFLMRIKLKAEERKDQKEPPKSFSKKQARTFDDGKIEYTAYQVSLENRSGVTIDKITAEYRIFYEESNGGDRGSILRVLYGKEEFDLAPGTEHELKTGEVAIRDLEHVVDALSGASYKRTRTELKDDLKGVLVAVTRQDRLGVQAERELKKGSVPKKEEWEKYKPSAH